MKVERAERARIIEHDARPIVEAQHRARESRQFVADTIDVPVAGHPEMGMEHTPVGERDELMLSAPLDRLHPRAAERSEARPRYAPAERRMQDVDAGDRLADDRIAQPTNGAFDFR
jgi:hypothetical protein